CDGYDVSECSGTCGDGVLNAGHEACDGNDFGGASCTSLGYASGALACVDCALDETDCVAPVALSSFAPTSFTREGMVDTPTFPQPLVVGLSNPALVDTFVTVGTGDPAVATVKGGGVTVLAGQRNATVLLSGVGQG